MSIADVINAAAAKYGIDPAYLLRAAQIESSMNPGLANPRSSAKGLFQFIDSTRARYGNFDPYDPAASSDAAARLAVDNAGILRKHLGREPTNGELYLAHQQGAAGAAKLLASPDAPAESVVGLDAVRLNGGRPGETASQFASRWIGKFGGAAPGLSPGPINPQATPSVGTPAVDTAGAALPMLAMNMPPLFAPPQEEEPVRPKKKQGLDLGGLMASLSPNLVLGRA